MADPEPSGTAVVPAGMYEAPQSNVLARKRAFSDPGTVELIRTTVAKDCNNAELAMFLELAARYDLDPFAKHIYAVKIKGRVVIIVAKDGMLAIANRHADFRGSDGDVVREHDYFEKWTAEDNTPMVDHRYGVPPTAQAVVDVLVEAGATRELAAEVAAKLVSDGRASLAPLSKGKPANRGAIVGAWSIVYREGRRPVYTYASFDEYNKGENTWKSHPDAMMRKVPLVMGLREAFSIGGVVGEGEVPEGDGGPRNLTAAPTDDYGQDPAIAAKLVQMFDLLGYTQRKRTVKLAGEVGTGLDDQGRRALLEELKAEAAERSIDVPMLPHEEVIEGTVVEEGAPA